MSKILPILIVMTTVLYSCGQEQKPTTVKESKEVAKTTALGNSKSQIFANAPEQQNVDTKYVYKDNNDQDIIIENSYPRGGLQYAAPNGEKYVYAVFWTIITNETDTPLELAMKFPEDSYKLPSSPGRSFKLFIPSDTMETSKEPLFNYGLDLERYLDNNFDKRVELKRTIGPKTSSGFYVVTLFNKGVDGTLRTGLSVKEQKLTYRINDKEIDCGAINLNLKN
jgi:hypothetical protein